jgi:hypothetical protein
MRIYYVQPKVYDIASSPQNYIEAFQRTDCYEIGKIESHQHFVFHYPNSLVREALLDPEQIHYHLKLFFNPVCRLSTLKSTDCFPDSYRT